MQARLSAKIATRLKCVKPKKTLWGVGASLMAHAKKLSTQDLLYYSRHFCFSIQPLDFRLSWLFSLRHCPEWNQTEAQKQSSQNRSKIKFTLGLYLGYCFRPIMKTSQWITACASKQGLTHERLHDFVAMITLTFQTSFFDEHVPNTHICSTIGWPNQCHMSVFWWPISHTFVT